jgi:hypothetical protein
MVQSVHAKETITRLTNRLSKASVDLEDRVNELMKYQKRCEDLQ